MSHYLHSICPKCKRLVDGVTDVLNDKTPKAGDISICFYCKAINEFNIDLNLVELPMDKFLMLPNETRKLILDIRDGIQQINQSKYN